jgi:hypothetical protein
MLQYVQLGERHDFSDVDLSLRLLKCFAFPLVPLKIVRIGEKCEYLQCIGSRKIFQANAFKSFRIMIEPVRTVTFLVPFQIIWSSERSLAVITKISVPVFLCFFFSLHFDVSFVFNVPNRFRFAFKVRNRFPFVSQG